MGINKVSLTERGSSLIRVTKMDTAQKVLHEGPYFFDSKFMILKE